MSQGSGLSEAEMKGRFPLPHCCAGRTRLISWIDLSSDQIRGKAGTVAGLFLWRNCSQAPAGRKLWNFKVAASPVVTYLCSSSAGRVSPRMGLGDIAASTIVPCHANIGKIYDMRFSSEKVCLDSDMTNAGRSCVGCISLTPILQLST